MKKNPIISFHSLKFVFMKKNLLLIALFLVGFSMAEISANPILEKQNINFTFSGSNTETAGELTITAPSAGKVYLHFDGRVYSEAGTRILLAVNDTPSWSINDGHVAAIIQSDQVRSRNFSHTRVFNISAGDHTYYAVAKNASNAESCTIYGEFTVEFVADDDEAIIGFSGVNETFINVSNKTTVGHVTINPTVAGKAYVSFDGFAYVTPGDKITMAASDTENWGTNSGNVGIESQSDAMKQVPFQHNRVYDITPGDHTFYAIAHNYVETDGDGVISVYGSLSVRFIPENASFDSDYNIIETSGINLENKTTVGSIVLHPTSAGQVVVNFSGSCISHPGDRIILAASNDETWHINDGTVSVEAINTDLNGNCFSHSRVYDVTEGEHTYYAVAHNYVHTSGPGTASIYGILTAMFLPDEVTMGVNDLVEKSFNAYPNPVSDILVVDGLTQGSLISIFSVDGKLQKRLTANDEKINVSTTDLNSGTYIINVTNEKGTSGSKFVKR